MGTYHKGYFSGGIIIYLRLITREDKIVIPSVLQGYGLHWYHTYLLHTRMDRIEAMIFQHFYWPGIRNYIRKEVTNWDNLKRTKWLNKKYGKLTSKEAEEIPWNKICVDIIGPFVISRKTQKDNLNLKYFIMIEPVTGRFKITQYDIKREISITDLF